MKKIEMAPRGVNVNQNVEETKFICKTEQEFIFCYYDVKLLTTLVFCTTIYCSEKFSCCGARGEVTE